MAHKVSGLIPWNSYCSANCWDCNGYEGPTSTHSASQFAVYTMCSCRLVRVPMLTSFNHRKSHQWNQRRRPSLVNQNLLHHVNGQMCVWNLSGEEVAPGCSVRLLVLVLLWKVYSNIAANSTPLHGRIIVVQTLFRNCLRDMTKSSGCYLGFQIAQISISGMC